MAGALYDILELAVRPIERYLLCKREDLRLLARTLYDILQLVVRLIKRFIPIRTPTPDNIATFLHSQAQAALVAVDMLALAALMKAMGYLEAQEHQRSLVVIVLMTVFAICLFVGWVGKKAFKKFSGAAKSSGGHGVLALQWLIINIRLAEPALIFWFVLDLVSFLIFERRVQSVGFVFGSMFLLCSLVMHHGLLRIVERSVSASHDDDQIAHHSRRSVKQILMRIKQLICRVLWWLIGLIAGLLVILFMVWFSYADPKDMTSLDTLISLILSLISFILLFPILLVGRVINWPFAARAKSYITKFFLLLVHNISTILFIMGALIVGAFFPITDNLMSVAFRSGGSHSLMCPKTLGLMPNHIHALQIGIWLVYLLTIGVAIYFLEKQHNLKLSAPTDGQPDSNPQIDSCVSATLALSIGFFWYASHVQAVVRQWYEAAIC